MAKQIEPPARDRRRAGVRAIGEAISQAHWIPAALTRLYQETHPPRGVTEREAWEDRVTEVVNQHGDQLGGEEIIFEGLSAQLIEHMARGCADGIALPQFEIGDFSKLSPAARRDEVEKALYSLEQFGLVRVINLVGATRIGASTSSIRAPRGLSSSPKPHGRRSVPKLRLVSSWTCVGSRRRDLMANRRLLSSSGRLPFRTWHQRP